MKTIPFHGTAVLIILGGARLFSKHRRSSDQESFVLHYPSDCSPSCLISRQGESEIAISNNKSLESRRE